MDRQRTPNPAGPGSNARGDLDAVLAEVRRAVTDIEYGSVLIKIHQGEVVAIETSTKVRLGGAAPGS